MELFTNKLKNDILLDILINIFQDIGHNGDYNILNKINIHTGICVNDSAYRYKFEDELRDELIEIVDAYCEDPRWDKIREKLLNKIYEPEVFLNTSNELTYKVKLNNKNLTKEEQESWYEIINIIKKDNFDIDSVFQKIDALEYKGNVPLKEWEKKKKELKENYEKEKLCIY